MFDSESGEGGFKTRAKGAAGAARTTVATGVTEARGEDVRRQARRRGRRRARRVRNKAGRWAGAQSGKKADSCGFGCMSFLQPSNPFRSS